MTPGCWQALQKTSLKRTYPFKISKFYKLLWFCIFAHLHIGMHGYDTDQESTNFKTTS